MTRQEIEKRIEALQNEIFMLDMKDRWTNEDRATMQRMKKELKELEKSL